MSVVAVVIAPQRQITRAIKRARMLALIPFSVN
jgi:ribosomal protein S18